MPGIVGVHESEHNEKMADVGVWEPSDPGFGGIPEKVWIFSSSPMYSMLLKLL